MQILELFITQHGSTGVQLLSNAENQAQGGGGVLPK